MNFWKFWSACKKKELSQSYKKFLKMSQEVCVSLSFKLLLLLLLLISSLIATSAKISHGLIFLDRKMRLYYKHICSSLPNK